MQEATKRAIEAILSADQTINTTEQKRILAALTPAETVAVKLVTTKMACNLLDVSRRTLYSWERQGKIRAIRRSQRSIRFNLLDIKKLMLEGATE